MEHTKGELIAETKQSDLGTENPRYSIGIKGGKILFYSTLENALANTHELVRRWEAFEEGGLVEELRTACKEAFEYLPPESPLELRKKLYNAIYKLEAALAKN